jgi:hypothetical protein
LEEFMLEVFRLITFFLVDSVESRRPGMAGGGGKEILSDKPKPATAALAAAR